MLWMRPFFEIPSNPDFYGIELYRFSSKNKGIYIQTNDIIKNIYL